MVVKVPAGMVPVPSVGFAMPCIVLHVLYNINFAIIPSMTVVGLSRTRSPTVRRRSFGIDPGAVITMRLGKAGHTQTEKGKNEHPTGT